MLDFETVASIEDAFFIEWEKGRVTMECNFCSEGDYQFAEFGKHGSPEQGWLTKALAHMDTHHPELAPGGTK